MIEVDSLKLLQFLKDNGGLHHKISISALMDIWYPTPIDFSGSQYQLKQLYALLNTLEKDNLIKNIDIPSPNGSSYTWDIKKNIQVELTTAGDHYLKNNITNQAELEVNKLIIDSHPLTIQLNKSVINTNSKMLEISNAQAITNETIATNSTRQANFSKWQTWIGAFTGVFILGSLTVSLVTILQDNRINKLNLELQHKDSAIRIVQKDIILLRSDTAHLEQVVRKLQKK